MYQNMQGQGWDWNQDEALKKRYLQTNSRERLAAYMGRTEHSIHCRLTTLSKKGEITYDRYAKQYSTTEPRPVPQSPQIIHTPEKVIVNTAVTTKTFVGIREADTLNTDELLNAMEQEQAFIERLDGMRGTAVKKLASRHRENLTKLEALLELAIGEENDS